MSALAIRVYYRERDGQIVDGSQDYDLSTFAGFLPSIGDTILDPGVLQGRDRRNPAHRTMWKVVGRVFNPRDLQNYVALIVEERVPTKWEEAFVA